ncbi:MAG: hypothetical protein ABIK12_04445, partial [Pseudomonadota bacterium]
MSKRRRPRGADMVYWVRARKRPVTLSELAEEFGLSPQESLNWLNRLVEAGELIDHGGNQI